MKTLILAVCVLSLCCSNSSNPVGNTTVVKSEGDLYLIHFKNYGLAFDSGQQFHLSIPTSIVPGGVDSTTEIVFPVYLYSPLRWEYPTNGALFGMPCVYLDSVVNGSCLFHYSDSGVVRVDFPQVKLTRDTIFQYFYYSILYDPTLANGGDTVAAVGPGIRELFNRGFETFNVKHPTILDN